MHSVSCWHSFLLSPTLVLHSLLWPLLQNLCRFTFHLLFSLYNRNFYVDCRLYSPFFPISSPRSGGHVMIFSCNRRRWEYCFNCYQITVNQAGQQRRQEVMGMGIVLLYRGINLGLLQLYCNWKVRIYDFFNTLGKLRVDCIFFLIVGSVCSL